MHMLLKTGVVILTLAAGIVASHAAPNPPAELTGTYDYAAGTTEFWIQFQEE